MPFMCLSESRGRHVVLVKSHVLKTPAGLRFGPQRKPASLAKAGFLSKVSFFVVGGGETASPEEVLES